MLGLGRGFTGSRKFMSIAGKNKVNFSMSQHNHLNKGLSKSFFCDKYFPEKVYIFVSKYVSRFEHELIKDILTEEKKEIKSVNLSKAKFAGKSEILILDTKLNLSEDHVKKVCLLYIGLAIVLFYLGVKKAKLIKITFLKIFVQISCILIISGFLMTARSYYNMTSRLIKSIYLLDNGSQLRINFFFRSKIINIENFKIVEPKKTDKKTEYLNIEISPNDYGYISKNNTVHDPQLYNLITSHHHFKIL